MTLEDLGYELGRLRREILDWRLEAAQAKEALRKCREDREIALTLLRELNPELLKIEGCYYCEPEIEHHSPECRGSAYLRVLR